MLFAFTGLVALIFVNSIFFGGVISLVQQI